MAICSGNIYKTNGFPDELQATEDGHHSAMLDTINRIIKKPQKNIQHKELHTCFNKSIILSEYFKQHCAV